MEKRAVENEHATIEFAACFKKTSVGNTSLAELG